MTLPKALCAALAAMGILSACAVSGHPATTAPTRPAPAYHMASPVAYTMADVQFADRMAAYLNGALAISGQARARSSNPQVLELALGTGAELRGQLQQLLGWYAQWGKKPPGSAAAVHGWAGVPSQAQIRQLAALRGPAFDHAFLELITADQQGVLGVATLEQEGGTFAPARQLAAQLVSGSTLAIVRLKQMLKPPT